ncbi:MAG: GNAT family N-acetyltransferase [Chloroflexi bacterium]|nr:GNAT family N-acetyltransferase [Chloroflexota bacterium]
MTLTVRQYAPSDLEACRDLWRELTQRHRDIYDDQIIGGDNPHLAFDDHLEKPDRADTWVAEQDGQVVAFVSLLADGDEGEIDPIVVRSDLRSQGIGTRLLRLTIDEARRRGVRSLSIRPVARNVEAIALYHEIGFRTLGHIDMFMVLDADSDRDWKPGIELHGRDYRY